MRCVEPAIAKGEGAGPPALLERSAELELLATAVEATAAGDGGVVLLEGPTGIGKTELLRATLARAHRSGLLTLAGRGGELEAELGLGVARQLLEPLLSRFSADQRAAVLRGPAASVGTLFGLGGTGRIAGSEGVAAEHALFTFCARLAERRPMLLAIDDAHWADESSLRWIAYLVRRLDRLPILIIVARRTDEPGAMDRVLDRIAAEPDVMALRPPPLSESAVRELVRAQLGVPPEPAFARACREAAGGNPLFTRQLIDAARAAGLRARDVDVPAIDVLAPERVSQIVLARLDRLAPPAVALARQAALLGSRAEVRHAARLVGVTELEALEAADQLAQAGLLVPGDPLEFVHPVVRTSVYEAQPAARRAGDHARAARLLAAEGQPSERVALHLLRAPAAADPRVVEILRIAAADAVPDARVRYLRRAIAEPPPVADRAGLLAELGRAESQLYDPRAIEHLTEALRLSDGPVARGRVAEQLCYSLIEHDRAAEAEGILRTAIASLTQIEPEPESPAAGLLLGLHGALLNAEQLGSRLTRARVDDAIALAGEGRSLAQLELLCVTAMVAPGAGMTAAETARLATRALAGADETGQVAARFEHAAVWALEFADRLGEADARLLRLQDDARMRDSPNDFMLAASARAAVLCRRGALADAEWDARAAIDLARAHDREYSVPVSAAALIITLTEQGRTEEAEEIAASACRAPAASYDLSFQHCSLGCLRLAQGRPAVAAEAFLDAGTLMRECGHDFPGFWPWRIGLALSRLALGDRAEAAANARRQCALVEPFGAPGPIGVAKRTLGLIEGGPSGLELLAAAARLLDESPAVLERARAQLELGAALRRAGRRANAREPLRNALDLADRCGAAPLVARAREELVAAGGRPRRVRQRGVEALTASELRVARRAAAGNTNRAIASELFVTVKTVERHLASAYRKLDVDGRATLAAALVDEANQAEA